MCGHDFERGAPGSPQVHTGCAPEHTGPPPGGAPSLYSFSRRLTKLLRHDGPRRGVPVGADGFVPVGAILSLPENKLISLSDIFVVVHTDPKQRFQLALRTPSKNSLEVTEEALKGDSERGSQEHWRILPAGEVCCMRCLQEGAPEVYVRATQGHSICEVQSELLLSPVRSRIELEEAVAKTLLGPEVAAAGGGAPQRASSSCGGPLQVCVVGEEGGRSPPSVTPSFVKKGVTLVHGTYLRLWGNIKIEGLKRMRRRHVHFVPYWGVWRGSLSDISPSAYKDAGSHEKEIQQQQQYLQLQQRQQQEQQQQEQVQQQQQLLLLQEHEQQRQERLQRQLRACAVSGFRDNCDLLIVLDFEKSLEAGLKIFVAANGVALTEGDKRGAVPSSCIAAAVERHSGRILN